MPSSPPLADQRLAATFSPLTLWRRSMNGVNPARGIIFALTTMQRQPRIMLRIELTLLKSIASGRLGNVSKVVHNVGVVQDALSVQGT